MEPSSQPNPQESQKNGLKKYALPAAAIAILGLGLFLYWQFFYFDIQRDYPKIISNASLYPTNFERYHSPDTLPFTSIEVNGQIINRTVREYLEDTVPMKKLKSGINCTIPIEKALASVVHINKTPEGEYKIDCAYGPYHDKLKRGSLTADYHPFFATDPNLRIKYDGYVAGKIISCTPETAKRLDELFKIPRNYSEPTASQYSCEIGRPFPSIPENLSDYYIIAVVCAELTKEMPEFEPKDARVQCYGDVEPFYPMRLFVITPERAYAFTD